MRKILTIAAREYRAMVGTKAFLISITMMPILMFGGIIAMNVLRNVSEVKDKKIAVIDQSGVMFAKLKESAELRNSLIDKQKEANKEKDDNPFRNSSRYQIEEITADGESSEKLDQLKLELSDQIRQQKLYAFVVIPPEIVNPDETSDPDVSFYAQDASISDARQWIAQTINEHVRKLRLQEMHIDEEKVRQASLPVQVAGKGLVAKSAEGKIEGAEVTSEMTAIFLPMGVMMLMFMVIFMASQPMLESVLEEKSQRIAEVLLGSASPFQLMMGKLIGTVGGSLTVFITYLLGGYIVASYNGWTNNIPFELTPWFIMFQLLGVLLFASIFMAIGAAVNQLKEAQSMLIPVWMMMMSPMFVWFLVIREPNGAMARWMSFFPPATPTMFMLRMSTGQTIPLWEPIAGLLLLVVTTLLCVIVAGRIFRIGLLWQGKTPKLNELFAWALKG
jgi:ABC-2 type transport system permease protein